MCQDFRFSLKQIICSTEGTIEINHYHTHFLQIQFSLINFIKSINGITGHPLFLSHFFMWWILVEIKYKFKQVALPIYK
jgi:hypothetical protein